MFPVFSLLKAILCMNEDPVKAHNEIVSGLSIQKNHA
jgi:hypothetical protein